ncbi:MAG: hypothetical protein GC168_08355 [Candidatus Hydrogenedens sp.]|nr:hypothetical protein [Candidatus Hydrogenedens sp.]
MRAITRHSTLSPCWIGGLAVAVASLALPVLRTATLSLPAALILVGAVWVCLLPMVWHCQAPQRPPLPFLPLIGLFYLFFFVLPGFFFDPAFWLIGKGRDGGIRFERISETTALAVLLGSAALVFSFGAVRRLAGRRIPALRLPEGAAPAWLRLVVWWCLAAHLAYQYFLPIRCLPSVGQALGPLGLFAYGYLFMQLVRGRLTTVEKILYIVVFIPAKIIFHLSEGLITPLVILVVLLFCLYIYLSRGYLKHSWRFALVLIGGIIVIYPFKGTINAYLMVVGNDHCGVGRATHWAGLAVQLRHAAPARPAQPIADPPRTAPIISGTPARQNVGYEAFNRCPAEYVTPVDYCNKGLTFKDYCELKRSHNQSPTICLSRNTAIVESFFLPILKRISHIAVLNQIVEYTPNPVPYWNGVTLINLITNMVPRFLWRDKPEERLGQEFAHAYYIVQPSDQNTSWNVPWLVEFYMNFGLLGTVISMAVAGIILSILAAIFNRAGMADLEVAAGATIIFPLFYQESNVSVMAGSLVLFIGFLLGFLYVALRLGAVIWPQPIGSDAGGAPRDSRSRASAATMASNRTDIGHTG